MKTKANRSVLKDASGATAVEFALYSTVFVVMVMGAIYASLLGYASASLHSAVESAARCRSMGITCTNAATTTAHALSQFQNVTGAVPGFNSDTQACGNRVTGNVNFQFNWILSSTTIPLTAAACFP